MDVDRLDDGDHVPTADKRGYADSPVDWRRHDGLAVGRAPDLPPETRDPQTYRAEPKAEVEAEQRAYAVDQGYVRVHRTEETVVTPALRRVEAEDSDRQLVGLEFRLKGSERVEEKVAHDMQKRGVTAEQAFDNVKDAIRYTFQYPDEGYSRGARADIQRIKAEGFELRVFRNLWTNEEYKGIHSHWQVPENGQLFEVQFHTQRSFEAKQETHAAYELLRTLPEDHEEVHALHAYQREVAARIPVPREAPDVTTLLGGSDAEKSNLLRDRR